MDKHTPEIAELLPEREYRCDQCTNQVFSNQSHLQLHLRRRHKVETPTSAHRSTTAFHCPVSQCPYHAERVHGRSFPSLRLLRQHYQKMHLEKKHICENCGDKFLLPHHLERHQCVVHQCPVCELTYNSKAGLRTHMRRQNHLAKEENNLKKVAIAKLKPYSKANQPPNVEVPLVIQPIFCYLPTQLERLDMETQTEDVDLFGIDLKNEVLAPLLRHTETQTPDTREHQGTMTETEASISYPSYQDQGVQPNDEPMFGLQASASTNMYTQTCDDLFEELGLSHIQTQTHWPDDDGLYNTQHTQTCDEMLDELLENFQSSTYTQTRWLDWQETENNDSINHLNEQ